MNSNAPRATVTVAHHFSASAERVFDSWTDHRQLATWMALMNPDEQVVSVTAEVRVGGSFSFIIRRNGKDIDHFGDYLEADRPRRLVFTWMGAQGSPDTAVVTITIVPAAHGCDLTLSHDMPAKWGEMAPRFEKSWLKMLSAIGRALGAAP